MGETVFRLIVHPFSSGGYHIPRAAIFETDDYTLTPYKAGVTFTYHALQTIKPHVSPYRMLDVIHVLGQRMLVMFSTNAAHDGKARGTGLGLAVVKLTVEVHDGTITFESGRGNDVYRNVPSDD